MRPLALSLLLFAAVAVAPVEPGRAAAPALQARLAKVGDGWLAWPVAAVPGRRLCSDACAGGCRLEGTRDSVLSDDRSGSATLQVFVRAQGGHPERVRVFDTSCAPRTQGVRVVWDEAIGPAQSAALLGELVLGDRDRVSGPAFAALAHQAGPEADARLLELARVPRRETRKQALFWLGQRAGEKATAELRRAIDDDPDSELRQHAVFAISQEPDGEGVPTLVRLARTHRDPEVRRQAFFWLGQSGDRRALALFEEVLAR